MSALMLSVVFMFLLELLPNSQKDLLQRSDAYTVLQIFELRLFRVDLVEHLRKLFQVFYGKLYRQVSCNVR